MDDSPYFLYWGAPSISKELWRDILSSVAAYWLQSSSYAPREQNSALMLVWSRAWQGGPLRDTTERRAQVGGIDARKSLKECRGMPIPLGLTVT